MDEMHRCDGAQGPGYGVVLVDAWDPEYKRPRMSSCSPFLEACGNHVPCGSSTGSDSIALRRRLTGNASESCLPRALYLISVRIRKTRLNYVAAVTLHVM
jgi:hypothetical protein